LLNFHPFITIHKKFVFRSAGRCQIVEELGGGGMGKVYRALDTKVGEEIADKTFKLGTSNPTKIRVVRLGGTKISLYNWPCVSRPSRLILIIVKTLLMSRKIENAEEPLALPHSS
jgi:serine/threonine protein kinase